MRINGHNVLAIVAAAIAIYAIEFIIYGLVISPAQFMEMSGETQAQADAIGMTRMPYGPIMPLMAAIGLSLAIKWRGAVGAVGGAVTAVIVGVFIAFSSRLYGYVYGVQNETYLAIDFGRYMLTYAVGGAILGAWK
jgi:Protein of unknown function (DUF1761)